MYLRGVEVLRVYLSDLKGCEGIGGLERVFGLDGRAWKFTKES